MHQSNRLLALAMLAVGAAGGWLAASGRLSPLPARAAVPPAAESAPGCCEGAGRGVMLA